MRHGRRFKHSELAWERNNRFNRRFYWQAATQTWRTADHPVGPPDKAQELVKLTRRTETEFKEEHLSTVRFVSLVGSAGRVEDGGAHAQ